MHHSSLSSFFIPRPVGRAGEFSGDRRPSSVCPSVRLSVCLMSRTSALNRKPKGLGRWNFAQGYPRSHATPTPTSRWKGQKSRSRGGGILWRSPSRTACLSCDRLWNLPINKDKLKFWTSLRQCWMPIEDTLNIYSQLQEPDLQRMLRLS